MFHFGFTKSDLVRTLWAGGAAFVGAYYAFATGLGQFSNFNDAKAAALAILPGAIAAAIVAAKNAILADGSKAKG